MRVRSSIVRSIVGSSLCVACAAACASRDEASEVAAAEQAVTAADPPRGERDVPLAGSESQPPDTAGPPVAGPPVDPALLALQQQYLDLVAERLPEWERDDLSAEAIDDHQAAIKRDVMGED
jgi:hypothetical protein